MGRSTCRSLYCGTEAAATERPGLRAWLKLHQRSICAEQQSPNYNNNKDTAGEWHLLTYSAAGLHPTSRLIICFKPCALRVRLHWEAFCLHIAFGRAALGARKHSLYGIHRTVTVTVTITLGIFPSDVSLSGQVSPPSVQWTLLSGCHLVAQPDCAITPRSPSDLEGWTCTRIRPLITGYQWPAWVQCADAARVSKLRPHS